MLTVNSINAPKGESTRESFQVATEIPHANTIGRKTQRLCADGEIEFNPSSLAAYALRATNSNPSAR